MILVANETRARRGDYSIAHLPGFDSATGIHLARLVLKQQSLFTGDSVAMDRTTGLQIFGSRIQVKYALLWRIAAVVMCATLVLGCNPIEVRVTDTNAAASESAVGHENEQGEGEPAPAVDPFIETTLVTVVSYLTIFAEVCGALVIAIAVIQGLAQYVRFLLRPGHEDAAKDDIRLRLGRSLAVALEFALAADILKTAVAPTWDVIAQLAAIIVLRTMLNYFLEREIRHVEERRTGRHLQEPAAES